MTDSAIAAGVAASTARIERVCIDCLSEFTTSLNQASRSTRCPACQQTRERDLAAERSAQEEREKRVYIRFGPWRLVSDPCKSWSSNAQLYLSEWRELAAQGYLDEGMVISDGETAYRVRADGKVQVLEMVFE